MILDEITAKRKKQLARETAMFGATLEEAEREAGRMARGISNKTRDFAAALKKDGRAAVIAEVKKASPSKGVIAEDFDPYKTAELYEKNGADAVSVLTEEHYFQGRNEYLSNINVSLPLLRKDFITEAFQIYHARILGADAVLLIAAILEPRKMRELVEMAQSLSLGVLAEAHNERELEAAMESGAKVIGINNRDLTTFEVDLAVTERLAPRIGSEFVKVSESGIFTSADIARLRESGIDAVLVGEALMCAAQAGGGFNGIIGGAP